MVLWVIQLTILSDSEYEILCFRSSNPVIYSGNWLKLNRVKPKHYRGAES